MDKLQFLVLISINTSVAVRFFAKTARIELPLASVHDGFVQTTDLLRACAARVQRNSLQLDHNIDALLCAVNHAGCFLTRIT